jgi:GNAT superfamily N-acetyltransferase
MEEIKFKFIDILDSPKKKRYFRQMRKWFLEAFPGESAYIKTMRKILRRRVFFQNEIFRLLLVLKEDKVIGGAVYRHWFDYKVSILEYLFVSTKLRNQGIGTRIYKRIREDLKRMKSKGLFFNVKGIENMDKCIKDNGEPVYSESEKLSRIRRCNFYRRLGARPLRGIKYSFPVYWYLDSIGIPYTNPLFCYDPLKRRKRVRVSANLVKKIIKRTMKNYYETDPNNSKVRTIFRSIKTQKLEWVK